jgi:DNA-binding transcriptional MocR family regulator
LSRQNDQYSQATAFAPERYGPTEAALPGWLLLLRESGESLVEQIVRGIRARIDDRLLRSGVRMPSIRQFADANQISRFTVVEAYDRLVAQGYLESRRGSGFYVRSVRRWLAATGWPRLRPPPPRPGVGWMWSGWCATCSARCRRTRCPEAASAAGLARWRTDRQRPARRQPRQSLPAAGLWHAAGFPAAAPAVAAEAGRAGNRRRTEQIVLTTGVTQGLDTVARHFLRPGDVIFVDDPAWFLMFGSFAALGAKVVGIPRLGDGPDIAQPRELAAVHKPKLYVINSVLHNPTSTSLSAAKAFQVLRIAEEHDFIIVEDDIYCDMHPGSAVQPATRIAALDQLQRVIYLGGFPRRCRPTCGWASSPPRPNWRAAWPTASCSPPSPPARSASVWPTRCFRKDITASMPNAAARLNGARDKVMRQLERWAWR